jgi:murein DD-endopeptidase
MVSLSIDPPHRKERTPSPGLRRAAVAAGIAAAFGAGFWTGRATAPPSPQVAGKPAEAGSAPAAAETPAQGRVASPGLPAEGAATPATGAPTVGEAIAAPGVPDAGERRRRVAVTLSGSLEETLVAALPPEERRLAVELTAVVNRLLVWEILLARDGRKGDRIEVVWTPPQQAAPDLPPSGEPVVDAVRYASSKLGTVFAAYRFHPPGARWARYYRADGTELELRLVGGPIGEYEQVTSLLRDGRRHKGVDFKTPVGSPVLATFDGVVERRNWNFAGNGNCLDVRDPATGRRAIFLHLDVLPKDMIPGRKVRKGEVIAASGNSGRSFAPHLHYQLEDGTGRVLDPFAIHRTERLALGGEQRVAFELERAALDAALDG